METKDYWLISRILFIINIVWMVPLFGIYLFFVWFLIGKELSILALPLVALVFVVGILYFLKKPLGHKSAIIYFSFLVLLSLYNVLKMVLAYDFSPEIVTTTGLGSGIFMVAVISLVLHAVTLFAVWKTRELFGVKGILS